MAMEATTTFYKALQETLSRIFDEQSNRIHQLADHLSNYEVKEKEWQRHYNLPQNALIKELNNEIAKLKDEISLEREHNNVQMSEMIKKHKQETRQLEEKVSDWKSRYFATKEELRAAMELTEGMGIISQQQAPPNENDRNSSNKIFHRKNSAKSAQQSLPLRRTVSADKDPSNTGVTTFSTTQRLESLVDSPVTGNNGNNDNNENNNNNNSRSSGSKHMNNNSIDEKRDSFSSMRRNNTERVHNHHHRHKNKNFDKIRQGRNKSDNSSDIQMSGYNINSSNNSSSRSITDHNNNNNTNNNTTNNNNSS